MRSITYFFRKEGVAYSIENVFQPIMQVTESFFTVNRFYAPKARARLLDMLINAWAAKRMKSEINHITGDVHYLCLVLPRCRLVLTIHDMKDLDHYRGIKGWIYRKLWYDWPMKRARVVTFISEFTKLEVMKRFALDQAKCIVIHNPVLPIFRPSLGGATVEKPVVLAIGTSENKNLSRLIDGIAGIDVHLRIIGQLDDGLIQKLRSQRVDYSNTCNLTSEEILREYELAQVVSFVSTYEGFGLPIVEAQSVGRAVLASNIPSLVEIAGTGAHFVNPLDIAEIRVGIEIICCDHVYRQHLVNLGFCNAKRFQVKEISEQYAKIYQQLVDEEIS